jgi:hypothetical protein
MVLLALVACGEASPPDVVRERDAAGIEWVRNRVPSGWADTNGWRFVEERVMLLPDSGPGAVGMATAATLGPGGLVYVAGRDPMGVAVFDSNGTYKFTIGRGGEGPGEFRFISLGALHDTVLVQDPSLARLSRFGPDGRLLDIVPTACCMMGPLLPIHSGGGVSIPTPAGWLRSRPGGGFDSLTPPDVLPSGKLTWTFPIAPRNGEPGYQATVEIPYAPSREAAILPSGLLVWGTTDRYRLFLSRTGRDTLRVIEALAPAVPLADSLRAEAFADARGGNGALAYAKPMSELVREGDIPRSRPLWSAVQGDGEGRLWVGLPDRDRRVARLEVFDSTGVLLGSVPSPHKRIMQGTWVAGRVVVLDEDANGRGLVRIFRIDTTRGH